VPAEFGSDSLWNYEAGVKAQWLDRRLTINASAYYIDWSNVQQNLGLACGLSFATNVGKASSKGIELEVAATPIQGLDISAGLGLSDPQLEENVPLLGGRKGDTLVQIPAITYNVIVRYTHAVESGLDLFVQGDYRFVDEAFGSFNKFNTVGNRASYHNLNLRAGVTKANWEAVVFVDNTTNERPELQLLGSNPAPIRRVLTTRPTTIGLTVSTRF
jgi:outer membrane receptor protein involved in Fe transport